MDSSKTKDISKSFNLFELEIQLEDPLDAGGRVFKCQFPRNKRPLAVKRIQMDDSTSLKDWQSLMDLRNENVVTYHCSYVRDSFRYLLMDLCWASMMDFCLGRLIHVSNVEIGRIMAETARGLDFLHRRNIIHGRLRLDHILLWRKRPDLKPIAKLSGYYPSSHQEQFRIQDDLEALGCIFYSMAAKDINPPRKLPVSSTELSLISLNQRESASEMINHLLSPGGSHLKPTSVQALLHGQSFFEIHCSTTAQDRMRNVKELEDFNDITKGYFDEDDVKGLKEILIESSSAPEDVDEFTTKAIEKYPKLFAEFLWDLLNYPALEKLTFKERSSSSHLGSGSAGMILAGQWIQPNKKELAVACKRFYKENNGMAKFHKEYEALRQLDHFFVVQCIKACQIEEDPYLNNFTSSCIIMELCEGTLKNYVLGELATIPKDSLDEKNLLGQVTLGLAYIHSKEMIHKDLKPSNILIWRSPGPSSLVVAKLADFDFAKQLTTARGEFSGTYRPGTKDYMAPELILTALEEQNKNQEKRKVFATVASDAYSLGITMAFTLLKGKHPFGNAWLLRADIMKSGADPFLLGDLEWDAIDLILRLTRKDPQERPKISFLIYHPYFALANEKSRAHFAEKLDDYFNQFPSPYKARMAYVNRRQIQEWMSVVQSQTEREANIEMKKWLEQKTQSLMKETQDHLDKSKEYYEKIKKEIQSDNDNDVNQTFHNDASKSQSLEDYFRDWPLWTRRLIKSAPRFSVSYFWCLINDRVIVEDDPRSKHSQTLFRRYYSSEQNKLKLPDIDRTINIFKMDEHVHACLYLKCQEEMEQVWNVKRAGRISDALTDGEIHRLLRELPSYAAPSSIIKNLINRMDNINSYDENQTTLLHWMLKNRWQEFDVSIITHLLERKANPKMGDKDGTTPVHYAAKNETSQGPVILRYLLEKNGDPNQVNGRERKRTALHYAAMNESSYAPDIVKILLEFGGQVQVDDKHGFTPLHYAARNKSKESLDILKILLDKGANPNKTLLQVAMVPPFNRTPVHIATMNESESGLKILKMLLERGGDPNVYDSYRETPFDYAAKSQSDFGSKMIEILVENKGNLALPTHLNKFPIHFAAENKSSSGPSIMKMILKHGGDPNVNFPDGGTAVHIAARNQSQSGLAILQLLLDNNGDPNSPTGYTSPVHSAAKNNSLNGLNLLKLLLEKGGDPNALDADGKTPVHWVAQNESDVAPEILKLLLEKGGKVFNKMKITPIHVAAANESNSGPSLLKILLENGADPNAVDDNRETPVHYATKNQSSHAPSILEFLLNSRGNCNVFNRINKTPFVLAVENTSDSAPKLLEILLRKGFDPNVVNPSGTTSVHLAAANESNSGPRILALLLENGGDCNVADGDKKTPIHYAAKNRSKGATEMMKSLMDKGADPNATSSTGLTPVHLASSNESCSGLDILKVLHEKGVNLDVADDFGTRPIHLAAQTQMNSDIIQFLLDNGDGHVNVVDFCRENITKYIMPDQIWRNEELLPDRKRKRTPVHYAAENEKLFSLFKANVIQLLLERGGDPNFEDERKRTAVHLAVRNGGFNGPRILKILLKNKGNPNAVDDQMRTPVHMAAMAVHMPNIKVDMMKLLLEYHGDPNAVDSLGRTPLHYAAINTSTNAPKMMELLLKHGGDPGDVHDSEGKTAIDLAADGQSVEMQNILKNYYKNNKLLTTI